MLLLGPHKHAQCQTLHTESEKNTNVKSVDRGMSAGTGKCCLKTGSGGAEVMSSGSLFQMLAPATGNDRLPNVVRRQNGRVKRLEEADLSLCRLCTSTTLVNYDDR